MSTFSDSETQEKEMRKLENLNKSLKSQLEISYSSQSELSQTNDQLKDQLNKLKGDQEKSVKKLEEREKQVVTLEKANEGK